MSLFRVHGLQVDAGVAAAQLGVGGQRPLPGRLVGLVPGRAGGDLDMIESG